MSPVSRGRKSKKQKKAQKSRQRATTAGMHRNAAALATLRDQLSVERQRPKWFDPSIAAILQHSQTLMTAAGPRELEQATAELTGAEVHRALREERAGLWFDWWFQELARAAGERVAAEAAGNGDVWQAPWRLLHGLAAIGSPALRSAALQAAEAAAGMLAPEQAATQPEWLSRCPDGAVTGQVWVMHDGYRTRFAVFAESGYPSAGSPHGADPHIFLLDIDACGFATLAGAAAFDSLEQAAAAWRQGKGDSAGDARPEPVTNYTQLDCLVHCDLGPEGPFRGGEPRAVTDNLFRASRRVHDIAQAMAAQGHPWGPEHEQLYAGRDGEVEAAAQAFSAWYARRHGSEPHGEAVRWLAADWLQGTLPGYGNAVSPHRVKHLLAYMDDDWRPEEPATKAAYELLPEWVRWNGEQAGVPRHLIERSAAVAEGQPWPAGECPAFAF